MFLISMCSKESLQIIVNMARNIFFFFLQLLLYLWTKNSFLGPILWSHRYLELFNFSKEEEKEVSRKGRKQGLEEIGRKEERK